MQVAGIRRTGDRVEIIEVDELRPLADDEVLLEVMAAGAGNWDELATRFADGQLEIPVAASYRLADAAQAVAQVAGGHTAGAVVLTP